MAKSIKDITLRAALGNTDRSLGNFFGQDVLNVKDYGAIGNGSTDDYSAIQSCFEAAYGEVGASPVPYLHKIVFFPPGNYLVNSTLQIDAIGVRLQGSGKHATRLFTTTPSITVLSLDAVGYCAIKDMSFVHEGGGTGSICLDWSNFTGTAGNTAGMCFSCLAFIGGDIGARIGEGTGPLEQASEATWLQCDFWDHLYGMTGGTGNALNIFLTGGSVRNCSVYGIDANQFAVPMLQNFSFSNNGEEGNNSLGDFIAGGTITVRNCVSTSSTFAVYGGMACRILNCDHSYDGAEASSFARFQSNISGTSGGMVIEGCHSTAGVLSNFGGTADRLYLRGNNFENTADYLDAYTGTLYIDDILVP